MLRQRPNWPGCQTADRLPLIARSVCFLLPQSYHPSTARTPSKRYTHDTIRPISYYGGEKEVDLGFVGSCMVHKGDLKIVAQMLRTLDGGV